ncbi:MAG: type II toxin-antitoxin system VapC family toxin [Solirubrobacteraceae bacterium]
MSVLLDTNVVSEIRRGRDANVAAWARTWEDVDLYLSVLSVGEIRKGIERLRGRDPRQAEVFATWLGDLHERFGDRILPVDTDVADDWGRLNAQAERKTVDSLIAATARVHDFTVATRNTADFDDCDVRLLNPWQSPPAPPPASR